MKLVWIFTLSMITHFSLSAQTAVQKMLQKCLANGSTIVMAHRMAPMAGYAENSLRTFAYNIKKYPNLMQEIDVRVTSDGIAILNHDTTLNRTSDGKGALNKQTFQQLSAIRLKDNKGNLLEDRIPTLQEVLSLAHKNQAFVMLDMKPGTSPAIMMDVVKQTKMEDYIIVICYSLQEGIDFHKNYPNIVIALGFNNPEIIQQIYQSHLPLQQLVALTPKGIQDENYYASILEKGIPISFSAQDDVDKSTYSSKLYRKAAKMGNTIICTDSLQKVIKVLKTKAKSL